MKIVFTTTTTMIQEIELLPEFAHLTESEVIARFQPDADGNDTPDSFCSSLDVFKGEPTGVEMFDPDSDYMKRVAKVTGQMSLNSTGDCPRIATQEEYGMYLVGDE